MTITPTGFVGIGKDITSPSSLLHIRSLSSPQSIVQSTTKFISTLAGGNNAGHIFVNDGDYVLWSQPSGNIGTTTNLNEIMRVGNDGNVGIGTATPQNTLNVIGDINATGNYIHLGNTGYTGTCVNITYSGGLAITCND